MTTNAELTGQTIAVTGANSGIGLAATAALSAMGATVIMVCRSPQRAAAARDSVLATQPNGSIEIAQIDLSSLDSVRQGSAALLERHDKIHGLINNAAIWLPQRTQTEQGTEAMWATNVLGPFLLTERLLPALRAADGSRIINLTSSVARGLDLDDPEFKDRTYSGIAAYGQSKQANRMWTWDLADRHEGGGITANAVHPGGVGTSLARHHDNWFGKAFDFWGKWLARTPAKGAQTAVWLAASPQAEGHTGKYWVDRKVRRCPHRNPEAIARLREVCLAATAG